MKRNDYCIFLGMFVICVVNMLFMHINVLQYSQVEEVLDGVSWIDNCCRIFIDLFVILLVAVILMQGRLKSSMQESSNIRGDAQEGFDPGDF